MADIIGAPRHPAMRRNGGSPAPLAILAIVAFVAASLWVGREVFVPIAIAVLLSFVLAPLVRLLRNWGLGRTLSVLVVVTIAFLVIFAIGAVFTRQITDLAADLPRYESIITKKVELLRGAASHWGLVRRATQLAQNLGTQLNHTSGADGRAPLAHTPPGSTPSPTPVIIQRPAPAPLEILESVALRAFEPLVTAGIVLVFVIFILLQREDLRDRIIRLAGSHDLQRTTAAIDDAARRLSRYFLAQTAINACFGLLVSVGLFFIGVPSAPLWGILAAIMRFVPYVGSILSAVFPLALSAAVAPGWAMTLETAALFLVLEPIVGQFVEPLLYGHSTGLSPIAVVIAATFWTWLWGPVGLVLSTPLTVCLVVLGRHVDQLEFLDVLLGDAPPLTPVEAFYQRVLAGHPIEAAEQAERILKKTSLTDYYNEVALPGLFLAQADLRRGMLDDERQRRLLDTIEELVDALSDRPDHDPDDHEEDEADASLSGDRPRTESQLSKELAVPSQGEPNENWKSGRAILCVPGRSCLDKAAGLLLAQLLAAHGLSAEVEEGDILAARRIGRLDLAGVRLVCLSYLDAELNPAHVRFVIRRLRRRAPNVLIMAGFWAPSERASKMRELCLDSKVDSCATDLAEAVEICLEASRAGSGREKPAAATPAVA